MNGSNERWYRDAIDKDQPEQCEQPVDLLAAARAKFAEQYDEWMRHYPGHWVAYHGGTAVCVGESWNNVYWRAREAMYPAEELTVVKIQPDYEEDVRPEEDIRLYDEPEEQAPA